MQNGIPSNCFHCMLSLFHRTNFRYSSPRQYISEGKAQFLVKGVITVEDDVYGEYLTFCETQKVNIRKLDNMRKDNCGCTRI